MHKGHEKSFLVTSLNLLFLYHDRTACRWDNTQAQTMHAVCSEGDLPMSTNISIQSHLYSIFLNLTDSTLVFWSQPRLHIDQRNITFGDVVTTHWTGTIGSSHSTANNTNGKQYYTTAIVLEVIIGP